MKTLKFKLFIPLTVVSHPKHNEHAVDMKRDTAIQVEAS